MRLYDGGRAPNPRRVRIFLSEKGIAVPIAPVDLGAMEHKSERYSAVNPLRRVPALELDDGTVITESIAICRYFEAMQPEPALFGVGALEIARVEMWQRRIELHLLAGIQHVFRHLHPAMTLHGRAHERQRLPCFCEVEGLMILPAFGAFTGTTVEGLPPGARCHAVGGGAVWADPHP